MYFKSFMGLMNYNMCKLHGVCGLCGQFYALHGKIHIKQ